MNDHAVEWAVARGRQSQAELGTDLHLATVLCENGRCDWLLLAGRDLLGQAEIEDDVGAFLLGAPVSRHQGHIAWREARDPLVDRLAERRIADRRAGPSKPVVRRMAEQIPNAWLGWRVWHSAGCAQSLSARAPRASGLPKALNVVPDRLAPARFGPVSDQRADAVKDAQIALRRASVEARGLVCEHGPTLERGDGHELSVARQLDTGHPRKGQADQLYDGTRSRLQEAQLAYGVSLRCARKRLRPFHESDGALSVPGIEVVRTELGEMVIGNRQRRLKFACEPATCNLADGAGSRSSSGRSFGEEVRRVPRVPLAATAERALALALQQWKVRSWRRLGSPANLLLR